MKLEHAMQNKLK